MADRSESPVDVLKRYMEQNYFQCETDLHKLYNHAIIFLRYWKSDMALQDADTIVREILKGRKK